MIVISLGGSSVRPTKRLDENFVSLLCNTLLKSNKRFVVVVGGGYLARVKANEVRSKKGTEFDADMSAIKITRKNALDIAKNCNGKRTCKRIPKSFEALKRLVPKYKIVFMGGTVPGITTDTDAVLVAEMLKAKRVVNISSIAYIYNKDPNKFKNAKKIKSMSHKELLNLAIKNDMRKAGTHFLFDSVAAKIAYRSNIPLFFVDKNINEIKKALMGEKQKGTTVRN